MIIKSLILMILAVASFVVCGQRAFLPASRTVNPPNKFTTIAFKKDGSCNLPQLTYDTVFKGGATTGEEITITLNTTANTYQISIDASHSATRQGSRRSGNLRLNPNDCSYIMSGEKSAQVAVNPDGVLIGGIDDGEMDDPPAAIIAFKDTSNRLRDLAGSWWVSGRETGNGIVSLSRPVPVYETTIQSNGKFSNCSARFDANDITCIRSKGSFAVHGTAFRSTENNGASMSVVLGNVNGKFVPVLLKRDNQSKGLHFLMPRTPQPAMLSPNS